MKKILLICLLLTAKLAGMAQFHLSGQVLNSSEAATMTLKEGFDSQIPIDINPDGIFNITIPLEEKSLAILTWKDKRYLLLLSPGKELKLTLSATDTSVHTFSGTAAKENDLLCRLNLLQTPFFRQHEVSPDSMQALVIRPWMAIRDNHLALIDRTTGISKSDKLLIRQEVNANTIAQLSKFVRSDIRMKRNELIAFLMELYKDVSPQPDVFPAGPLYYEFADTYVSYLEAAAFNDFQQNGNDPKRPLKYYGISLDSGNILSDQKGKMYLNWIAIKNNFDQRVAEVMLAKAVANKCKEKLLWEARPLMCEFEDLYPASTYHTYLSASIAALEKTLAANRNNKEIAIIAEPVTSIYQVVNKYKGKVVYLDIWGTWCGPCRNEMEFTPRLKEHFKDRDVVFLYLDMDGDEKDGQWKEFIHINNLTGLHFRKNNTDIQKIWEEVQPQKDKRGLYPGYFIFDRNGNLVQETAKRPSEESELYKQIEQYLLQP